MLKIFNSEIYFVKLREASNSEIFLDILNHEGNLVNSLLSIKNGKLILHSVNKTIANKIGIELDSESKIQVNKNVSFNDCYQQSQKIIKEYFTEKKCECCGNENLNFSRINFFNENDVFFNPSYYIVSLYCPNCKTGLNIKKFDLYTNDEIEMNSIEIVNHFNDYYLKNEKF